MAGPKYPNQQLRSVSLETYFAGRFSALAGLRDVQDAFTADFPNLFVPNARDGQALDLSPYVLRSADDSKALGLAINQATFVSFAYPGFAAFVAEALPRLARTLELIGISTLNRVVYKYENAIGLSRDTDGVLPVGQIFNFPLPDGGQLDTLREVNFIWRRTWNRGQFVGHLFVEKKENQETLVAVLAAFVDPAGAAVDLRQFAQAAHDEAQAVFERMITDTFRELIRGDDDSG